MRKDLNIKVIDGLVYCNEIDIGLTSTQIEDYVIQTGRDYMTLIEWQYNTQCKDKIRDKKLNQLLDENKS